MNEKYSPKSLLEKMQTVHPKRHVVFNAIDALKTPEEMKQFHEEYAMSLKVKDGEDRRVVAGRSIAYALVFVSQECTDQWRKAVSEIDHPYFGGNIPWGNAHAAYIKGSLAGQAELSKN